MENCIVFDAHADTLCEMEKRKMHLAENTLHIDAKRMARYKSYTQVFAVFTEGASANMEHVRKLIAEFYAETADCGITVCKNADDMLSAKSSVHAFLSMEGGGAIESVADLEELYFCGVRMLAPVWNGKNSLACGVGAEIDTGLTDFGKEILRRAENLGIIIDVSHMSPKSFEDTVKISRCPLAASHSNSYEVKKHARNLTDEQFTAIMHSGGVAGINLCAEFCGENIADALRHIDRFISLGGENNVGLGSDFDGTPNLIDGINGAEDMHKIIKALPYSAEVREKIAYKNFLRLFNTRNC